MRVLFIAALGAAVVFASPVYAAGHEKKVLFNEKQCSYYATELNHCHYLVIQAKKIIAKLWIKST